MREFLYWYFLIGFVLSTFFTLYDFFYNIYNHKHYKFYMFLIVWIIMIIIYPFLITKKIIFSIINKINRIRAYKIIKNVIIFKSIIYDYTFIIDYIIKYKNNPNDEELNHDLFIHHLKKLNYLGQSEEYFNNNSLDDLFIDDDIKDLLHAKNKWSLSLENTIASIDKKIIFNNNKTSLKLLIKDIDHKKELFL